MDIFNEEEAIKAFMPYASEENQNTDTEDRIRYCIQCFNSWSDWERNWRAFAEILKKYMESNGGKNDGH